MLPVTLPRRRAADRALSRLEREFVPFFRSFWDEWFPGDELAASYPVDIREDDGAIIVDAELPGFKKDDVEVSIDQDVLRITAERKPEEEKGTHHLTERRYTRVERAFTLPAPVDEKKIEGKLKDGVLHLRLPKTGEAKPRKIPITQA